MARTKKGDDGFRTVRALNQYATAVVAKEIPAGRYTIAACKRHIADLEKSKDPGYPYYFDDAAANRICKFAELMPHVKGQWARRQEHIKLQPWQCFLFGVAFGWRRRKNDRRRFREIYAEVPRKNGKSVIGAVIGNYMLLCDGEFGAEVFSGATSEKQAWEVFGPARLMLKNSPEICEAAGLEVNAQSLVVVEDNSSFKPLVGNPGDGASPSCAIVDEFHEHQTSNLYDTMVTGMGAREQPLCVIITTAGTNLGGPCFDKHIEAKKVLDGVVENEELFTIIFAADLDGDALPPAEAVGWIAENCDCDSKGVGIDDDALSKGNPGKAIEGLLKKHSENCRVNHRVEVKDDSLIVLGDDWADPKTLMKANPNFGVSVDEDFLLSQQRGAVINAEHQNRFKTKHLNIWCSAKAAWMNVEWWRLCADPGLSFEEFHGQDCYFILDLATRTDVCAFAQLFPKIVNGQQHYYAFGRYYLPESALSEPGPNQTSYRKWMNAGTLTVTDGTEIDFDFVRAEIETLKKKVRVREILTDDWQSAQLSQQLVKGGGTVVAVPLASKFLSPAMREMEAAIKSGRFHHNGDPMMAWMISNVVAKADANDNLFPRKEKPENKIDIAVCLIMGVYRAIVNRPKQFQAFVV